MTYTGVQMFMTSLKQLIDDRHNPLFNNLSALSERNQFQRLYEELTVIIHTLFVHEHDHLHEPEEVTDLKTRFKDAAKEAEYIIDLFLSAVLLRNKGLVTGSDHVFKTSLDLDDVMRSFESIKVEFMTSYLNSMKMDLSPRIDRLKIQSVAAGTTGASNPIGSKKPPEEVVVGHDRDAELIRDKLVEDQKQLDVISIVGMGGLGKTTLANKVFNDGFIVYHFHVRAWVTVSQTYEKRNLLIQILDSFSIQVDLEKDSYSMLRGKLHKHLMGKRYLIVIDDIWSNEAWDDLKIFFPNENTGSRILLTSRINDVALHAKPHGFVHSLAYLTTEQSWELLRKKVFHGNECPEWLIEPGMQIAKKCQGLPLSLVLMAGVLAKEPMEEDLWENIASRVSPYIACEQKGYLGTLALSYYHLPLHLRDCFLYLGGFREDFKISVRRLMWLWVSEGFIEEAGNQSLEDTAKAYLMDLIDRSLLMVAERKFDGDVKACKVHDLVRNLCLEKAKERFTIIQSLSPQLGGVITPNEQHRVFTHQHISLLRFPYISALKIGSFLGPRPSRYFSSQEKKLFRSFVLVRVLDLSRCISTEFAQEIAFLVHLRYLAIRIKSDFPSKICKLWSLQTLVISRTTGRVELPSNISDLVNLRHLWSNSPFYLASIDKPMNLQSISELFYRGGVGNFYKCFPGIKKLACTSHSVVNNFGFLPYLQTLKIRSFPNCNLIIWYPTTLKKLTFAWCDLPWSHMSVIQSLPNLEVLQLKCASFKGPLWKIGEQQFRRLKFLNLQSLDLEEWEVYSSSFPCLKRLQVKYCNHLMEIPLEIGDISMLELLEVNNSRSISIFKSLQKIQSEQHDVGNYELKMKFNEEDLTTLLQEYDEDYLIDRWKLL